MGTVKLTPSLPDSDSGKNGLAEIYDKLLHTPEQMSIVVATVVNGTTTVQHLKSGVRVPAAAITHIEVLRGVDATVAAYLLEQRYTSRTGKAPLYSSEEEQVHRDQLRDALRDTTRYGRGVLSIEDLRDIVEEYDARHRPEPAPTDAEDVKPDETGPAADDVPVDPDDDGVPF